MGFRLFQNFDVYPASLSRAHALAGREDDRAIRDVLHADRLLALHMLQPNLDRDSSAAFSVGHDERAQRAWARRHGLRSGATAQDILLAQIEDHRTEIFYNHDPIRFGSAFVERLPGSVKKSVAWRAAPGPTIDFGAYDRVVCNFPAILRDYERRGWNTAWFAPAHDPVMDDYNLTARPVDIMFVGSYSRHHIRRAAVIEALAELGESAQLKLHLQLSRMTRLAETPFGLVGPLRQHRRPRKVRVATAPALFGRDLYRALGSAKIVVNGAIDMAGIERGNMRCWEAMGSGALMLSDAGRYPEGMVEGATFVGYHSVEDLVEKARSYLERQEERLHIAEAGNTMIRTRYAKARQWSDFLDLL